MANPYAKYATTPNNPYAKYAGPAPQQGPEMPTPEQLRSSKLATEARVAQPEMGAGDVFRDSYTLGLQRPLAGLANVIGGGLRGDDSTMAERYQAGKEGYSTALQKAEADTGNLGTAASIAGSLATVGPKGSIWAKLAQGLGMGVTEGAARADDSLEDTARGAAIGGGVGLVGTGVGEGVGWLAQKGMEKVGQAVQNFKASPSLRARLELNRAVKEAGLDAQQIDDLSKQLGPEGMAIDVLGRTGGARGRNAANVNPEARDILEQATSGRKAGQNQRISDTLQEVAGIPAENSRQSVDDLVEATRRSMQPPISKAYKEAAAAGYDLPRTPFEELHQAPMFAQAYDQAAGSLKNRVATEGMDAASELARLDETKKILDSIGTSAARSGDLNKAGQAQALAKKLRETMDAQMGGPEYAAARSTASRSFGARRAARRGGDLAGNRVPIGGPAEARAVKDPLERQLQKSGYALKQTENLLNKGGTEADVNLLRRPLQQDTIEAIFGPDAGKISDRLAAEQLFNQTHKDVTGNSSTVRQLVESGLLSGGAGAGIGYLAGFDPTTSGIVGALTAGRKVAGPMIQKSLRTKGAQAAPEVARLLTEPAANLAQHLQAPIDPTLLERLGPDARALLARLITRGSIAGGTQ